MKGNLSCPICKAKQVEIGAADGYSQDIRECGKCGAIWTWVGNSREILSVGNNAQAISELVNEVKALRIEIVELRKIVAEKTNA